MTVFTALLECGVGFVQAFNARLDAFNARHRRSTPPVSRILVSAAIILGSVFIAAAIGLVQLIASGYRVAAAAVLLIYVVPLFTVGVARII